MDKGLRDKIEDAWRYADIAFLETHLTRENVNLIYNGEVLSKYQPRFDDEEQRLACFKLAISLGADTRKCGSDGIFSTSLIQAIRSERSPKLVKMLIEVDDELLYAPDQLGTTPLGLAAYSSRVHLRNLERITIILLENCKYDRIDDMTTCISLCGAKIIMGTALEKALQQRNMFCAKFLILHGASLNKVPSNCCIPEDIRLLYMMRQAVLAWLAFSRRTSHGKKLVCKDLAMLIAKEVWHELLQKC